MQVVETLRHLIFRHTINGEYIDIHAAKISQVSMLYDCGLSILYLGKGLRIIFIVLGTDHLITLRQPLLAVLYQQVIVTMGHTNIRIIVPRDKTLVAHSPQLCSCYNIICETMLATSLVNGRQYVEHLAMQLFQVVIGHLSN
jgi:hypothetical protein